MTYQNALDIKEAALESVQPFLQNIFTVLLNSYHVDFDLRNYDAFLLQRLKKIFPDLIRQSVIRVFKYTTPEKHNTSPLKQNLINAKIKQRIIFALFFI